MADENLIDEVVDTKVITKTGDGKSDAGDGSTLLGDALKGDGDGKVADKGATPGDKAQVGDWPADWREKASAGDAKKLQRITRYASPQALADALISAQNRISAGDLKVALGKDAKPEEIAAYREAHGIPEEAGKYDLTGIEFDQTEKPMIDKFLTSAHGAHMTPDQVRASIEAFKGISEEAKNERLAQDNDAKEKAEDKLRAEWGTEFRTNLNLITNLLDTAPQGVRDKLLHGRLADGTPIGSSTEVLQFLASLAREKNPSGVVVPSGVATESAVEDEITKIEKVMRENRREYNRDERMQARYRELLVWRENQRSKRAA